MTGSHLLATVIRNGGSLAALSDLERLPQILLNVPVTSKIPFEQLPGVSKELAAVNRRLEKRGRVLLRYSGTEPLARVMIEGEDATEIEELAQRIADAIRGELM